eukprot:TRINITY_DN4946_c0_g2_i1.p1 TRINITY_DN4946_c0_g2~~TRINITY_DN4946_c0_g2_i1.p1  ORF type:complete len:722 (-),score=81.12 TRINITY_DN4946_c0_g2_i1:647-2812(-)
MTMGYVCLFFCALALCVSGREYINEFKQPPGAEKIGFEILRNSAEYEVFQQFSSTELKDWGEEDATLSIQERLEKLQAFKEVIMINVRLVGFDTDGRAKVGLRESELEEYFDTIINTRERSSLINPEFTRDDIPRLYKQLFEYYPNRDTHNLALERDFLFSVTKAPRNINDKIQRGLADYFSSREDEYAPISLVNNILQQDLLENNLNRTYTVYILNPRRTKDFYFYASNIEFTGEQGSLAQVGGCPTTMWMDSSDRLMWIDLSAGPIEYGPQNSGEGVVSEDSFPNVQDDKYVLMTDIVTFVHKATTFVISPTFYFPLSTRAISQTTRFNIFEFVDIDEDKVEGVESKIEAYINEIDLIKNARDRAGVEIEIKYHRISLASDVTGAVITNLIYANSMKTHTSTTHRSGALRLKVHRYLDSTALHKWLKDYDNVIMDMAGADVLEGNAYPIYLFNIRGLSDIALLDREFQALAFPDMVIAVQTNVPRALSDFECDGEPVIFSPTDASRDIVAAMLSTAWGITPTHLTWDSAHLRTRDDFTFAVGNTPFGPFSPNGQLSFSQYDQMAKAIVYRHIFNVLMRVQIDFARFIQYELELDQILDETVNLVDQSSVYSKWELQAFHVRWNLLKYKLHEAQIYLTLNEYDKALTFALSCWNEVRYFKFAFQKTSASLVTSFIKCKDETLSWSRISIKIFTLCSLLFLGYFIVAFVAGQLLRKKAKVP